MIQAYWQDDTEIFLCLLMNLEKWKGQAVLPYCAWKQIKTPGLIIKIPDLGNYLQTRP